jgi:hypothetical protein
MADNLPFNTFIQSGYYRPLFGNLSPDHTTLAKKMIAYALTDSPSSQALLYRTTSIGTAPNVPYLNIHAVDKRKYAAEDDKTKGVVINTGLRFVTLGGSINYSFWSSEDLLAKTTMHSVSGGLQLGRTTLNSEFISLARDSAKEFRQSNLFNLETFTRIWRENYLTLAQTTANTNLDLRPGKSIQTRFGVRSFLYPGMDLSVIYSKELYETDKAKVPKNVLMYMLHSYF